MPVATVEMPKEIYDVARTYASRESRTLVDLFADLLQRQYGVKWSRQYSSSSSDWRTIPISPLVEELTGIIPDAAPGKSYRDIISDSVCERHLDGHEAVR